MSTITVWMLFFAFHAEGQASQVINFADQNSCERVARRMVAAMNNHTNEAYGRDHASWTCTQVTIPR